MSSHQPAAVGIIAGAGRFPFMVADGARKSGCHVTIIGLRGLADPMLRRHADAFYWSGLAKLGHWIRIFHRSRVAHCIMAGYVRKEIMYGRFRLLKLLPDWLSLKLWFFELRDKRNDSVLGAVAEVLQSRGITLESAVKYSQEALAPVGHLAGPPPPADLQRDIDFGWRIAKELGRLDIGQSVAVKETEVIAVEAIEGTDRMIERAGSLCPRGGWCLIKVGKPNQDMRFDVPTIGPDTIERLHEHGAVALVIEAGKTVIIDAEQTMAMARKKSVHVFANQ